MAHRVGPSRLSEELRMIWLLEGKPDQYVSWYRAGVHDADFEGRVN